MVIGTISNETKEMPQVQMPHLGHINKELIELKESLQCANDRIKTVHKRFFRYLKNDQCEPTCEREKPETFIECTSEDILICKNVLDDMNKYVAELLEL